MAKFFGYIMNVVGGVAVLFIAIYFWKDEEEWLRFLAILIFGAICSISYGSTLIIIWIKNKHTEKMVVPTSAPAKIQLIESYFNIVAHGGLAVLCLADWLYELPIDVKPSLLVFSVCFGCIFVREIRRLRKIFRGEVKVENLFMDILSLIRVDFTNLDGICSKTVNLERFTQLLESHKLATVLYFFAEDDLPLELKEKTEPLFRASAKSHLEMRRLVAKLTQLAESRGLGFAVIKGLCLNDSLYGADGVRSFGDLDILIKPEDAISFHELMNENGFLQKRGRTSASTLSDRYSRALQALSAKNGRNTYGMTGFPVKHHPYKPEYKPYHSRDTPIIEIHDGLYFLSYSATQKMLDKTVSIRKKDLLYRSLDTIGAFLLLLTNTFENSESFASNIHDNDLILRDYVDLRFFFERYKDELDWQKIENLIDEFEIRHIAEIIIGNLFEVYGRDVTIGCLSSIKPRQSEWGVGIIERMQDSHLARSSALGVMRKRWLSRGSESQIIVSEIQEETRLENFRRCNAYENVLFHIEHDGDAFVLSWVLPAEFFFDIDSFLFQFQFFPLKETEYEYTSYKVNLFKAGSTYKAFGNKALWYTHGAIRKETENTFRVSDFALADRHAIRILFPFSELGLLNIYDRENLCVSEEIYRKHYEEIYHELKPKASEFETHMHLIEMQ
jgi:hypothetical protein